MALTNEVVVNEWVFVPDGRGGHKPQKVKKTKEQIAQQKIELAQQKEQQIQDQKDMVLLAAGGAVLVLLLVFVLSVAYQMKERNIGLVHGTFRAIWSGIWLGLKIVFMTTIGSLVLMAGAMVGGRRRR